MSEQLNAAARGRQDLAAWKDAQPRNFFDTDPDLQRILRRVIGDERYQALAPSLSEEGRITAEVIEPLVAELEYRGNLPRLDRWDAIGRRVERIEFDGRYHEVGRPLYASGVVAMLGERGNLLHSLTLNYLQNQLGEAGHNCPIVCTMGMVRVLREAGSEDLKRRFLPGLTSRDYSVRLAGAQFMTEVQGGSDVGANAVMARPLDDGTGAWRLDGEKWFCSVANADLFLVTARPQGAAAGTKGLGLFLVPRHVDGRINGFHIRRLKEKLGTRCMASGEMDFVNCVAWPVGPVEDGFKTMMNHVINTSRICNASGSLGMSRRALHVGWTYTAHRRAFGAPIRRYPLVQETLASMRSEHAALLAAHFHLAGLRERIDAGQASGEEAGFYRIALSLNKYRTSLSASENIRQAIELLGGNGAIETFSPLPRLLRDNVVYENWEGTHNTLSMQVYRDLGRQGAGEGFLQELGRRFAALSGGPVAPFAEKGRAAVQELGQALHALADTEPLLGSLRMRPLCDRMSWLMAGAAYAEQAAWEAEHEGDERARRLLAFYWQRRLSTPLSLPDASDLADLTALTDLS